MNNKPRPQQPPAALLQNVGLAKTIYFDGAPVYGAHDGVIEIELAERLLVPRSDNTVGTQFNCAGHLRSTIPAAVALREALDKAIAMATKKPEPNEIQ